MDSAAAAAFASQPLNFFGLSGAPSPPSPLMQGKLSLAPRQFIPVISIRVSGRGPAAAPPPERPTALMPTRAAAASDPPAIICLAPEDKGRAGLCMPCAPALECDSTLSFGDLAMGAPDSVSDREVSGGRASWPGTNPAPPSDYTSLASAAYTTTVAASTPAEGGSASVARGSERKRAAATDPVNPAGTGLKKKRRSPTAPTAIPLSPESGRQMIKQCVLCAESKSVQWRSGPQGLWVCNRCGVKFRQGRLRPEQLIVRFEQFRDPSSPCPPGAPARKSTGKGGAKAGAGAAAVVGAAELELNA